jgi:hypothetical protein
VAYSVVPSPSFKLRRHFPLSLHLCISEGKQERPRQAVPKRDIGSPLYVSANSKQEIVGKFFLEFLLVSFPFFLISFLLHFSFFLDSFSFTSSLYSSVPEIFYMFITTNDTTS